MALRNIVTEGDTILEKKCHTVVKFDDKLATLLDDMAETLSLARGVGLAAPQVGILRRVVVININDELIELINPTIVEQSGEQEGSEGCLSCPGQWGIVVRPLNVTVKAQDRNGKEFTKSGTELLARCFCHELDHLDGVIFKERAKRMLNDQELEELYS